MRNLRWLERALDDPAVCSCGGVRLSMRDERGGDLVRGEAEQPVICKRCGKPVPVILVRLVDVIGCADRVLERG